MSLVHVYNGVTTIPGANVRLRGDNDAEAQFTSSAIAGGSDTAQITVDDPDGDLELEPMHAWTVEEDDCAVPRIWTGLVLSAVARRPTNYGHGPARVWDLDLIGLNAGPSLRLLSNRDSPKRPAETDVERIAWLVDTPTVTGGSVLFDDGYVDTSGPQNADEADFTGKSPAEVLNSILGLFVVKNWFIVWNPDTESASLFFGANDDGIGTSTLSISNVPGDYDYDTVFPPFLDGRLTRAGEDLASAVVVNYRGGSLFVQDDDTATEFVDRYFLLESDRIGLTTTAEAWADAYLAGHATWKETLDWTVDLPASKVNLLREGQVVTVRFSHLPGYETDTPVVMRRRTVQQKAGRVDWYTVTCTASNDAPEGAVGGGSPGDFPHEPPPDHWWEGSGTVGNQSGWVDLSPTSPEFVAGTYNIFFHVKNNNTYAASWRIRNGADTQGWLQEQGDGGADGLYDDGYWVATFTIPDDGDPVTTTGPAQATGSGHDFVVAGGFTDGYIMQGDCAGPHGAGNEAFADYDFYIDLQTTTVDVPPAAGQPVENEIPSPSSDGTTTVFTTRYPYATGSLRVYVDNLNQTGAVTESDPETGEFTLAFAPRDDETVRVWYLGR